MLINKLKNARKHISLLLIVMMLFSMCSVGIPAAAFEGTTSHYTRAATPTDASPTDASPTDATPTNASPTDASPTDATSTNPEEQPKTDIPKYYYDDSDIIAKLPTDYINGIMIAHYFNIMGAYDGQNNFKPNEPMKSSDVEYALKAIDSGEPTMSNFAGELLTVQALVHRIWLASGKGSYIYSAEIQECYLSTYKLGISYDENNDFANAWTFCVKNGIVSQFLSRSDFSVNLPVTRAMAAYALSNYYLWREGYDINNLTLDIPSVAPIDEEEMEQVTDATATYADGKKEEGVIKTIYNIAEYKKIVRILIRISNEYRILEINTDEKFTKADIFIKLPDYERLLQELKKTPVRRSLRKSSTNDVIKIGFGKCVDGEFIIEKEATVTEIVPQIIKGDTNGSGVLDTDDINILLDFLVCKTTDETKTINELRADYNSDGQINLLDVYSMWEKVCTTIAASTDETSTVASPTNATPEKQTVKASRFIPSALAYIRKIEAENAQNTATTFNFMNDDEEILSSITLSPNTHYLKLPKNTYKKENFSFNYWSLYRLDENGNKLYYCENADGTGVQWLQNETDEYSKIKFADESFIYNIPTGEFSELYFEANWISYNNFKYRVISDGTAEITKYKGNDTYVTIPSVINGYTVTSIGYWAFYNCTNLASITIPDTVTSIGWYAFEDCTRLTSITIPDSVKSIGWDAFFNCTSLTSITIPESVMSIGWCAFDNTAWYNNQPDGDVYAGKVYYKYKGTMPSNHTINISDGTVGIADHAFEGCTCLESITIPEGVTSIKENTFSGCRNLTSITIPDSVTSIGDRAFSDCTSLTSVTIPEGITSIGSYAFNGCKSLTSITLPDSVTSIGYYAFYSCTSLKNINIPNGASLLEQPSFGSCTFAGCTSLKSIKLPLNVTRIGKGTFSECTSLESIIIPDSVTSIGWSAFYGCTSLESITIPDSVTNIENYAFCGCTSLTSINIPDSITDTDSSTFTNTAWYDNQPDGSVYVGKVYYKYKGSMPENTTIQIKEGTVKIVDEAFLNCTNLISLSMPDSVIDIGSYAFQYCNNLLNINISDYVTYIGFATFCGCTSLTSITIPNSVTCIERYAFAGCTNLTNIIIPEGVTSIEDEAFHDCAKLENVTIPEEVAWIGGSAFMGCSSLTSITIPESVIRIGNPATGSCTFYGCYNLKEVIFSKNSKLDSIGSQIFSGCSSLTRISIPEGVTSINAEAFKDCTNLKTIEIPESVTSIGRDAFYNCRSLTSITIPEGVTCIEGYTFYNCKSLTSITVPDSVTSIGNWAFSGCTSLTSITIPNSVTSIGDGAFSDCTSLTSITIPDSVTSIEEYAFCDCTNLTSITIPESVTSIGWYAFRGCTSLTSITIPESVTSIGDWAFENCTSLTSIQLPERFDNLDYIIENDRFFNTPYLINKLNGYNVSYNSSDDKSISIAGYKGNETEITIPSRFDGCSYSVTSIGDRTFYNCTSRTSLTSITIPESVTSIGDEAFSYCTSLTSITIPESVTSIGYGAFRGCTSLTSITIPKSVTSIYYNAFENCPNLTISCYAGSYAQTYAINNHIPYTLITETP